MKSAMILVFVAFALVATIEATKYGDACKHTGKFIAKFFYTVFSVTSVNCQFFNEFFLRQVTKRLMMLPVLERITTCSAIPTISVTVLTSIRTLTELNTPQHPTTCHVSKLKMSLTDFWPLVLVVCSLYQKLLTWFLHQYNLKYLEPWKLK